jgi:hypothetical protein
LRAARQAKGLSVEDATYEVRALMGRKVTRKTIERYELHPAPDDRVDVGVVVALCRLYDVDVADVSAVIADRAERLSRLLAGNREPGGAFTRRYDRHTPVAA